MVEVISSQRVAESAAAARDAVDALLWDRRLASKAPALASEVHLAQAWATAAIDGIDFPESAWRSGSAFEDSPMGRAAAGVWRLERELAQLEPVWSRSPLQALARMHSLLARDMVPEDELGRPRLSGRIPDDPLRIGSPPPAEGVIGALRRVGDFALAGGDDPAVIQAALVHGALLAERPFSWGSGLVARYSARLTLAARGFDPDFFVATDVGLRAAGRPAYVRAIRAFVSGSDSGNSDEVASWVCFVCGAVESGARFSRERL